MNKIKSFWGWLVAAVGGLIGVLVYLLLNKKKRLVALETKIELADTQKKADLLEVEIHEHRKNTKLLKKEIDDLDNAQAKLQLQRENIKSKHESMTPNEIEQYWND